jgi:hypothetical protein
VSVFRVPALPVSVVCVPALPVRVPALPVPAAAPAVVSLDSSLESLVCLPSPPRACSTPAPAVDVSVIDLCDDTVDDDAAPAVVRRAVFPRVYADDYNCDLDASDDAVPAPLPAAVDDTVDDTAPAVVDVSVFDLCDGTVAESVCSSPRSAPESVCGMSESVCGMSESVCSMPADLDVSCCPSCCDRPLCSNFGVGLRDLPMPALNESFFASVRVPGCHRPVPTVPTLRRTPFPRPARVVVVADAATDHPADISIPESYPTPSHCSMLDSFSDGEVRSPPPDVSMTVEDVLGCQLEFE